MNNINWCTHFFSQMDNDLRELQNSASFSNVQEAESVLINKETHAFANWRKKKALKEDVNFETSSKPQEFSLDSLDLENFQKNLKAYNEKVSTFAREVLNKNVPELSAQQQMCLVATGSDGRQEKLCLSASSVELMLVVNKKTDLDDPLIKKVTEVVARYPQLFHPSLEVKCLEDGELMCYDSNPYPTRALDVMYMAGFEDILSRYQKQFFQELQDERSTRLIDKFSQGPRLNAFKLLKKALDGSKEHFDVETGILKYNTENESHKIQATKYPLLRTVQYGVALKLCKLVNKGELDWETFYQLPKSTVERVHWLANRKLLKRSMSESQAEQLKRAYTASLVWLEMAKRAYEKEHKGSIQVLQKDLLYVADAIDQLKDVFLG